MVDQTLQDDITDDVTLKNLIRKQSHENRRNQENKDELSVTIVDKFLSLNEFINSNVVMFYVDVRAEVRTRHALEAALATGKKIIVPWCNDNGELEMFHLESLDELEIGMYKILEPRTDLRNVAEKSINAQELDLIMVPGVAFDKQGGRTGHGRGYYDKLLEHARPDAPLVALSFECQMFAKIPMQDHDIYMDKVITETNIYNGVGRSDSSTPAVPR